MKKMKMASLLTAMAMLCGSAAVLPEMPERMHITAQADGEDYTVGFVDAMTYRDYGDHIEIVGCQESATAFAIPSEVNGVPVTVIASMAFLGKTNLTEVYIPEGITEIGDMAFSNCSGLTGMTLPASVRTIGESAFNNCSGLTELSIQGGVEQIGAFAFQSCTALEYVDIAGTEQPGMVLNIDEYAFSFCSSLKEFLVFNAVTSLGEKVFTECENLEVVAIPSGVTGIGEYAFWNCPMLTEVVLPDSMPEDVDHTGTVGAYAFYQCGRLKQLAIPDGITAIGEGAFKECFSLTDAALPDSVTEIGASAFEKCISLRNPELPENLNTLGAGAFKWCVSLGSVAIPESLTYIADNTFEGCVSLQTLTLPSTLTPQVNQTTPVASAVGNQAFAYCSSLCDIYYDGTEEAWAALNVTDARLINSPCLRFKGDEAPVLPETNVVLPDIADALENNPDRIFMRLTPPKKRTYQVGEELDLTGAYYDGQALISGRMAAAIKQLANVTAEILDTSAFDSSAPGLYPIYVNDMDQSLYFFVEVVEAEQTEPTLPLGNLNGDGVIDANDASMLLVAAAAAGSGGDHGLTEAQIAAADLNADGQFDASDASLILMYAAYAGAGGELDLAGFLAQL